MFLILLRINLQKMIEENPSLKILQQKLGLTQIINQILKI